MSVEKCTMQVEILDNLYYKESKERIPADFLSPSWEISVSAWNVSSVGILDYGWSFFFAVLKYKWS